MSGTPNQYRFFTLQNVVNAGSKTKAYFTHTMLKKKVRFSKSLQRLK